MTVKRSSIGWCDYSGGDANFIIGCDPISAGCLHCYARRIIQDRGGRDFSQVRCFPSKLGRLCHAVFEPGDRPYRRGPGSAPLVFPVDLGDLFHPAVPDAFVFSALQAFLDRPDVTWALLTKRARRMADLVVQFLQRRDLGTLPDHVWPGATVECDAYHDRLAWLLAVPSARRWISVEPMLDTLVLRDSELNSLAWVVCGAESGPDRRPFAAWWAESLYKQCREHRVPFFGKQNSGHRPGVPLLIAGRIVQEFPR